MSLTLILTGDSSDFTTCFNSIILDSKKEYEVALLSIDTYNSIPNITSKNNQFKYFNGQMWKIITLNTGAYELESINNEIIRQIIVNGDDKKSISILPELSTLSCIIDIKNPDYKVDFKIENSIAKTLGFINETLNSGYNLSPKIVQIIKINSILVNIDIIMGSYVNGSNSPAIYSFYPNVPPGYKIVERPNPKLIYYPLSRHDICRIRVWLTDQNNNLIDNRSETVTVRIHIREAKA